MREALRDIQLRLGAEGRLVTEGRDQGTAIFPEARLKFFLTAGAAARAERRFLELKAKGQNEKYEDILQKITERDRADETRAAAPLKPAPGAVIIDSTEMSLSEVLKLMEERAREVFSGIL